MRTIKKKSERFHLKMIWLIVTVLVWNVTGLSQKKSKYSKKSPPAIFNRSHRVLLIPIDSILITKTHTHPTNTVYDTLNPESYYRSFGNRVLMNECKKKWELFSPDSIEQQSTFSLLYTHRYSPLAKNTKAKDSVSIFMKQILSQNEMDFLIFPYQCEIREQIVQPPGWRNTPSYARPAKYSAKTTIHLQVWDKKGELIYENINTQSATRPFLYALYTKLRPTSKRMNNSKRYLAPPLVRSLTKAITEAIVIFSP